MSLILVALLQTLPLPSIALPSATPTEVSESNAPMPTDREFALQRGSMAAKIEQETRQTGFGDSTRMGPIIDAIRATPRHLFVPEKERARAYQNIPLPIGYDQTISEPYIMAVMTYMLAIKRTDDVLEIGTGSGYQAAILSSLVHTVHSIEIVEPLAEAASDRLKSMGYNNVSVRSGDGYRGWPGHPAFDAIVVTAGATHIPPALLEQLKPGGRMIIPLGPNWAQEELTLVNKNDDGSVSSKQLGWVFFVDFTGEMKVARPEKR